MKLPRFVAPVLVVSSVLGAAAVAVAYAISFSVLAAGPSMVGYEWLDIGNRGTWFVAGLVVVAVWTHRLGKRTGIAAGALALASGIVGGIAAGLWSLGVALASFDALSQPLDLNSLLLAVSGTGYMIAPAAIVLAVGAILVAATPMLGSRLVVAPVTG